jgi:ABC-2 type transport system permease protein
VERNPSVYWIALAQFLLHMVFVAVGFFTATLKIRSKAPMMIPIGVVLATYTLTLVCGMSEKLEFVKYLSPFYYTDVKDIIANNSVSAVNLLIVCAFILAFIVAGSLVYSKRDMPA